jgi:hypothetical protein
VPDEAAEANTLIAGMRSQLAAIAEKVASEPKTRTFVEIAQNPLYTAGSGSLIDDLVAAAGGENVVAQAGYVSYSLEQLLKDQPDVYLATKGGPLNTSMTPVFLIFEEALGVSSPINMGYASALAFILAVIIFTVTFVQRRFLERGTEMY